MTHCKVCGEAALRPLWTDADGGDWSRCLACGSDSAHRSYADVAEIYNAEYVAHQIKIAGDTVENRIHAMRPNLDWFVDYQDKAPGKDFLDIGHCEGTSLTGMQDRGWRVHGFDVNAASHFGPHTTIAPHFAASLFPQRYDAIMCREVIEHVENWRLLLSEAHKALDPGGLFQLQTPRPWYEPHPIPYQRGHLQLFTPSVVRWWLERCGFEVLDYRLWDYGQAWMTQRR